MAEIIEILMRRDGLSYDEAKKAYFYCRSELLNAIEGNSCLDVEEILMGELDLEMDYIWYFI